MSGCGWLIWRIWITASFLRFTTEILPATLRDPAKYFLHSTFTQRYLFKLMLGICLYNPTWTPPLSLSPSDNIGGGRMMIKMTLLHKKCWQQMAVKHHTLPCCWCHTFDRLTVVVPFFMVCYCNPNSDLYKSWGIWQQRVYICKFFGDSVSRIYYPGRRRI